MTRVVLLIALYLTLDFADPSMPGALNFDADLNADVILHKARTSRIESAPATPQPPALHTPVVRQSAPQPPSPGRRLSDPFVADWLVQLRRAHAPGRTASPVADDH